jgi:hypothetical protein
MATLPYNSTIYKNALTILTATILAGQTTSDIVNCVVTPIGAGTIIGIKTLATFTPCDLTFRSVDLSGIDPTMPAVVTDGVSNTNDIIFPNVLQLNDLSFPPFFFFSKEAIQIVSSVPQVSTTEIRVLLQPIVQGVA